MARGAFSRLPRGLLPFRQQLLRNVAQRLRVQERHLQIPARDADRRAQPLVLLRKQILLKLPPPPSRESRWDPPAHLWSARTGSRPAALWRLINSKFVPNTVLAPTFLLPHSAGGRAFARPPFSLLLLCFVRRQPTTLPVLSELPLYVPFVTPLQPSNMT